MVKDTPSRQKAREIREVAHRLSKEANILEGLEGLEFEAQARRERAKALMEEMRELADSARLEDITVRQNPLMKRTKKGEERIYYRWVASWQEGNKTRTVYLGSCKKMSHADALAKAKKLKVEALGKAR